MEGNLNRLTVVQLREECQRHGLEITGLKKDLVDRLLHYEFREPEEQLHQGGDEVKPEDTKHENLAQGQGPPQQPDTMAAITSMMTMMTNIMKNSEEERRHQRMMIEHEKEEKLRQEHLWQEQLQKEREYQDRIRKEILDEDKRNRAKERQEDKEARKKPKDPPIQRLRDEDDIENFLTVFEKTATLCKWSQEYWTIKLGPSLTGKAQEAYASVRAEDANNYDVVKAAILKRYSINEETYRKRFRNLKRNTGENVKAFNIRLHDVFDKWMKDVNTVDKMKDKVIKEQLVNTLSDEVQTWVKEHNPKSADEVVELADNYIEARHTDLAFTSDSPKPYFKRNPYRRPAYNNTYKRSSQSENQSSGEEGC